MLYLAATFVPWMAGFNFDPSECIPQVLSFADVSQFNHDPSEVIPPDLLVGEAILIAIRPRLFRLNGGGGSRLTLCRLSVFLLFVADVRME
ncbi:MAG: hypothetical protein ACRDA9_01920 [Plesiomonas shigelloides]